MKTVSVREFYHNAALVDGLPAGKQLVVTANGQPKFVVSKSSRPKMTRELAESQSVGRPKASIVSTTRLKELLLSATPEICVAAGAQGSH